MYRTIPVSKSQQSLSSFALHKKSSIHNGSSVPASPGQQENIRNAVNRRAAVAVKVPD